MTRRIALFFGALTLGFVGLGLSFKPTAAAQETGVGEKLFFALEVLDGTQVLARPNLVGVEGKPLKLFLSYPNDEMTPKLVIELTPSRSGSDYDIGVSLSIPGSLDGAKDHVRLGNGEEREVAWNTAAHPVRMKVLLMRVSSPEFKAYLDLGSRTPGGGRS
jgi:hypothetical protein